MSPPAPLSDAFAALSRFFVADASLGETLQRVADIAVEAIPAVDSVGMSMLDDEGKPTTAIFTDKDAPEIDQAQYDSGRGPCLDAWRTQEPVRLDDIEADAEQYAEFRHAALAHGAGSSLSLPLAAGGKGIGAMNLYASKRQAFSEDDEALGAELATAASAVLANSVAYWGAYELSQQLQAAMESRATIEQAKGILMARSPRMTPDDAFDVLVKASQRENVKLREVAQRVVDGRGSAAGK